MAIGIVEIVIGMIFLFLLMLLLVAMAQKIKGRLLVRRYKPENDKSRKGTIVGGAVNPGEQRTPGSESSLSRNESLEGSGSISLPPTTGVEDNKSEHQQDSKLHRFIRNLKK